MTLTAETSQSPSPSPNVSWVDELPPVELPEAPPVKEDTTPKVPAGMCQGCGEVIVREPGSRGRMPRYHPDCKPLRSVSTSVSAGGRNTRKEAEAEEALAAFKALVVKGAIMISMVDRYDAFCVMVSLPQICDNLRGVLIRYDTFRKEMLALKGGGSVIALALSVLMLALPIAAHHGLIPKHLKIAQVLVNAPFTLHRIQQKLTEGEAALTKLMEEQIHESQAARASANGSE